MQASEAALAGEGARSHACSVQAQLGKCQA